MEEQTIARRPAQTQAGPLVSRYLHWLAIADGKSPQTVKTRQYILRPFANYLLINDIGSIQSVTMADVDAYIANACVGYMPSSVNQVKQAIRHFLWYCESHLSLELGLDYLLIRRHREAPRKPTIITLEQVQEVVAGAEQEQDGLMIAVAFETGVRIGELVKIRAEDIYGTEIRVRGKGSQDRTVYMSIELSVRLRRHVIKHGIRSGPIFKHLMYFEHLMDDAYGTCRARERIQREFLRHGIKMVPHDLRHSFAIRWVEQGGDIRTLQKILGHSSLEVTQRYLQISDRFTEETYKKTITKSVFA